MTIAITITYKAFSNPDKNRLTTSLSFVLPSEYSHFTTSTIETYENILDKLYDTTNTQSKVNKLWQIIEPLLPVNRTHTSLSVGDEITINTLTYRCADVGWKLLEKVGA